jgi:putative ubiquitin-RnfH superfamily antitoxin RatB of RatAB toxin-antitoxin module
MKIGIAYASPSRQTWLNDEVPDGATVKDAIERSGILKQFPEIDLEQQKVGIFSKLAKLDALLEDGDRVEIYRPITCDPKTVKRRPKSEEAPESES